MTKNLVKLFLRTFRSMNKAKVQGERFYIHLLKDIKFMSLFKKKTFWKNNLFKLQDYAVHIQEG